MRIGVRVGGKEKQCCGRQRPVVGGFPTVAAYLFTVGPEDMMGHHGRRCTRHLRAKPVSPQAVDWTVDAGPVEDWLQRRAVAGWVPEYGQGVETSIGGRTVSRWAMLRTTSPQPWEDGVL